MPRVKDQLYTRPPLERMMRIHARIRSGQFPNCEQLATELDICSRTVKRDLDFMRDRFNLPIAYDSRRYGFFYTEPVEQFPNVAVTEAETFALLVAHKAIAQYQGTPFQKPLEAAFRKLTGLLDSKAGLTLGNLDQALSFRPFAPDDTDLDTFQILSRGVQERREARFLYKNLGAQKFIKRHVRPYHLACIDNHWYLLAFDLHRKEMRNFVLTRLKSAQLTPKSFPLPADFKPDDYLRHTFVAFTGKDDYSVAVEFDAWATDLLRGRRWHASQEFIELPSGCSRLVMRLNSIEEMERFVLSWGVHATVIQPKALAERVCTAASHIAQKYSARQSVGALPSTEGKVQPPLLSLPKD
jgi:proteasome accessory factor B